MPKPESARVGSSRVGQGLFLLIGLVALAIGAWQGVSTLRFVRHAVATTGRVLGDGDTATGGESPAHPRIEFRTAAGMPVRYSQNGMGSRPVGSAMRVLYDPAAPADTAIVPGFWTLWFPALGPLLFGALFIAVALSGVEIGVRGARP